jgi:Putative Flp pilus-assembly TadE/G-like
MVSNTSVAQPAWWLVMRTNTLFQDLRTRLKTFACGRDGNVAVMFALAIVPIVGLVGAAVDYSRANAAKAAMQAALDSTVLMLSKEAAGLTQDQLNQKAKDYFKANFTRPGVLNVDVKNVTYATTGGSKLSLEVTGSIDSNFMGIVGMPQMPIATDSMVRWGNTRLRVALALDNTGSMSSAGKMDALKKASHKLLDTLKSAAALDGDVYVSIIPFAREVNVGADKHTEAWVDWTDWDDDNGENKTTCTSTSKGKGGKKKKKCSSSWVPDNHNTWNGCITDRDQPNDTTNTTPKENDTATPSTGFPAIQSNICPTKILPQSYEWKTLHDKIDAMTPNGNTNQGIGLAWGWMSLTEGAPLNPPAIVNDGITTRKILILLSDGLNTENRWYDDAESIDARQKLACDNVKAAGVVLYTVHVNTDGDPTSTLLQNCASPDDVEPKGPKFFILTSANQVVSTFDLIGTSLTKLRLAQ